MAQWEDLQVPGMVPLLEALNAHVETLARALQEQPARPAVPVTMAEVELPLTLETIRRTAIEADMPAAFAVYDNDYIVAIPPNSVNVQSFPTYGNPATVIGGLHISSDSYSATGEITVQIYFDSYPILGANGLQLTGPKGGPGSGSRTADYGTALTEIRVVTTNNTPALIHVNFAAVQAVMTADFYQRQYQPLIEQYGFAALRRLVGD